MTRPNLRRRAAATVAGVLVPGCLGWAHPAAAVAGDTISATDSSPDPAGALDVTQATRAFTSSAVTITITTAAPFTNPQADFVSWMDLNGDGLADVWVVVAYDTATSTLVAGAGQAGSFHLSTQGVSVSRPSGSSTAIQVTVPLSDLGGSTTFDWAVMSLAPGTAGGPPAVDLVPDQPTVHLPTPVRIAGPDRVQTAVQSSFFADGQAGAAVLARSDDYPDALGGAPLAAAKNGPLLLTSPTSLDPATLAEIQRVLPQGRTVYLLGGLGALSQSVEDSVKSAGYNTVRYAGADRFATALQIVQQGLGDPTDVFLTTGTNFPDALAAGAAAAGMAGAAGILLTNGSQMPSTVSSYLQAHPSDTVFAVGGPAAAADPQASTTIVGTDRYDTSVKVAQTFFQSPTVFGVASGVNYPDALAGGATIGEGGGPLLLTDPNTLSAPTQSYLSANKATMIFGYVFGGTAAVSDNVVAGIDSAVLG